MTSHDPEAVQLLILSQLSQHGSIPDTRALDVPVLQIKAAIDSLALKEYVDYTAHVIETHILTPEGCTVAERGSSEYRAWETVGVDGCDMLRLEAALGKEDAKVGQLNAFKRKWIKKGGPGFIRAADAVQDTTRQEALEIQSTGQLKDAKALQEIKKRKLCSVSKSTYYSVTKASQFKTTLEKQEADLTAELLQSGAWKNATFKKYNFAAEGAAPTVGALHPLMKVREEFRNIFFEMGFSEMPTNRFVESSFWNFDALFVPQQHPARDMQDTFFIKDPDTTDDFPAEYLARVKAAHEDGSSCNSTGYRYPWKESEASKLVLRTHTTAISARMLYQIANAPGGFKPSKLFSIDRVFRNETVDATHLAEFHQVEGVVVDYNITLGDLIGFMEVFFKKMGVTNLRFKPAYNPYTEPSLEIFSYHVGLKKWVEIGNSGMFRPEMLEPMGLPKGVRALGWGLSLERPTMIRYGIDNIRSLLGHKVPIDMIENSSAIRFK